MDSLVSPSGNYLLQTSLQDLHHQTMEWQSLLELWKHEIRFFRGLLSQYGKKVKIKTNITERNHLSTLLSYYTNELMPQLSEILQQQEIKLKPLLSSGDLQNEIEFREEHESVHNQIKTITREMISFKHELYDLIEKVLRKENENAIL